MLTTLQQEIENVLKKFPSYWDNDILLKNVLIEDIRNYQPELLSALLKNPTIKKTYSLDVDGFHIFKVEEFVSMLRYKNYLENSYTKYSNEIGLTSDEKYLKYNSDIILDFPHKDGVLEGGMTKEDSGKKEIYYHNILAKEEIDTLLSPKILNNIKKYDINGCKNINKINPNDNLILKGNNLIALHTLKNRYADKVKLIYIDPPYNTGGDSFKYNDRFNHSTWLTFMKNRLEIAFELLREDGVIVIQSDNNENHYLKVLCDEIFGSDKFVTQIAVEMSATQGMKVASAKNGNIVKNAEYLSLYSKSGRKNVMEHILYDARLEYDTHYSKYLTSDNKVVDVKDVFIKEHPEIIFSNLSDMYKTSEEFKKFVDHNQGKIFSYDKITGLDKNDFEFGVVTEVKRRNRNYHVERKENNLWQLMFLKASYGYANDFHSSYGFRKIRGDWWSGYYLDMGNVNKEGSVKLSNGKKPERLIKDLIIALTNEKDIVMDFFMGSGTTPAVSLKTNRQFIGVEQLNYIDDLTIERLKNVIDGDQSGISKNIDWQGGGSFVYAELFELNQLYINELQEAVNTEEIEMLIHKIKTSSFLNIKVDIEKLLSKKEAFFGLTLKEQKSLLIQVLDNNQLYLNYSEIDDEQYAIDDQKKSFNHSFYQEEV